MDPFSQLIFVISVTSFLIFQWLFHKGSPWVSKRISPGFLSLSDKQKVEWNSRTVSTFHAILVGIFCLCILLFDDAVNEDPVWGDPTLVKINVAITTGYLISDLLLIFYYWKAIGDKFFVIHHVAALYAYYYVLLVLRSAWLSQDLSAQYGKWHRHGSSVFHGPHRCHASLLHSHVWRLWHGSLLPGAVGWPCSLDLLQHLPGHHEHYVDAQDRARLLQSSAFSTPKQRR
ncbi:transmembrane protein 56-B isoform X2 [Takifugu rubripes]|uniref:transmembrane protein 56-B isoform X2 n=1 Tax=Takifugu rubripes TaxID=31033 RepID=UPI00114586A0|nr:transmembrane protein 56 isoform X2 [Takifugu rubripes]